MVGQHAPRLTQQRHDTDAELKRSLGLLAAEDLVATRRRARSIAGQSILVCLHACAAALSHRNLPV